MLSLKSDLWGQKSCFDGDCWRLQDAVFPLFLDPTLPKYYEISLTIISARLSVSLHSVHDIFILLKLLLSDEFL